MGCEVRSFSFYVIPLKRHVIAWRDKKNHAVHKKRHGSFVNLLVAELIRLEPF